MTGGQVTDYQPIIANIAAIVAVFAAFFRYGRVALRRLITEEVRPTLDAVESHALEASRGQRKLARKVNAHAEADEARFAHILDRLNGIESKVTPGP